MPDFIPRKDADVVAWSLNFSQVINNAPAEFGLTADQAVAFAALQQAYAAAYKQASSAATRSQLDVSAKDDARAAMVANARMLARIVRALPTVNGQQLRVLGLHVPAETLSRSQAPADIPLVAITGVRDGTLHIALRESLATQRCRIPNGAAGAAIFYFIGDEWPNDPSAWTFATNVTRTRFDLNLPMNTPRGSRVWVMAYWLSTRAERGPASRPAMTYIGSAGVRMAA